MTLSIFISLFAVNFVAILTKSFQQKNVQHNKLIWIFPTSMIMAGMEVFIIGSVATLAIASGSLWAMLPMGCGAACGAIAGVILFNKLSNEGEAK
jgi:hypothetical protein